MGFSTMGKFIHSYSLNIRAECAALRLKFWQCPPVLFIALGFFTIISIVAVYVLSSSYFEDPEIPTIFIVTLVTVIYLIIGYVIINSFNTIAEANRMKSEFISIASHQLRTPLSIFNWTLNVLERDLNKLGTGKESTEITTQKSIDSLLQNLHTASARMIQLVNSLLDVTKIEAGVLILKGEGFSLDKLTKDTLENFKKYASASNIEIRYAPPSFAPLVDGDVERISLVIQNLLDNAIRYTESSGLVEIAILDGKSQLTWRISDQGMGISDDKKKYIFQKFFRADTTSGSYVQPQGSGIGLYIAKAIVEASGGAVGFDSKEKKGSTFWFTLPKTKV